MKNKLTDHIIFLLVGSLYVYCLSTYILSLTIIQISSTFLFLTGFAMLTVFFVLFYNKYTFIISMVALSLVLLYVAFQIPELIKTTEGELYELAMYMRDAFLFVQGYLPYEERYASGIVITVSLILALFAALSFYIRFNYYMLSLLGMVVFVGSQILGSRVEEPSFLIFLFCNLVFFCKQMNLMSLGGIHKNGNGVFTLGILPLCVLIVVLANMLPSPKKDYKESEFVAVFQNQIKEVNDFFYGTFNPKYFSFQSTGFSQNPGRLGGNVALNDRSIMTVYSDERVYLRGTTKDTYTGDYWINEDDNFTDYSKLDLNIDQEETMSNFEGRIRDGFLLITDHEKNNLGKTSKVTIQIGENRTGTLFTVLKSGPVQLNEDIGIQVNQTGDLKTKTLLEENTEYSYDYCYLDYGHEAIVNMMRQGRNGFAQRIHDQYMSLPESVPERVYEQAERIAGGQFSDYDKIKALETYLTEFPYTLSPGDVPKGKDFVDYFLFEGQQGYCTYYASALAVMSRCIGIPSRYVEGYILPPVRNTDGSYTVTNKYAHAWAEIYLEGFGWVPFEATAPYRYSFYQEEMPVATEVFTEEMMASGQYQEVVHDLGYDQSEKTENGENGEKNEAQLTEQTQSRLQMPAQAKTEKEENSKRIYIRIGFGFLFLLGVVLSIYLFYLYRRVQERYYLRYIKTKPLNEQAVIYFKGMIKMAAYYHYPFRGQETPLQYASRIGKRFAFNNERLFMRDMVRIYYKAEYGRACITEKEKNTVEDAYFELLAHIKSMRWKPVFIYNKYFAKRM